MFDAPKDVTSASIVEQMGEEVIEICEREGLSPYIEPLNKMINRAYRGVDLIEHTLLRDPEVPEREQVCFEIHITGKPDEIIEDQREFYRALIKQIPREKRDFFTFTYHVS